MRGKRASDCCSPASSRPLAWDGDAGGWRALHPLTSSGSSWTATGAQPVRTAVASRSALHAMRGSAAFHGRTRVHAALHVVPIREDKRLGYSSGRVQGSWTCEGTPTCKGLEDEGRAAPVGGPSACWLTSVATRDHGARLYVLVLPAMAMSIYLEKADVVRRA